MHIQMKLKNCASGIRGVMEEGGVEVGVIGQQVEDVVALVQMGILRKECKLKLKLGKPLLLRMFEELKLNCKGLLT